MDKICKNKECITPVTEQTFNRKASSKDGFATVCKVCKASKDKIYREQNKKKVAEGKLKYKRNNKEKVAETNRSYYQANKERIAIVAKCYREANKEELSAKKSEYYKTDAGKIVSRAAWHRREAIKRDNTDNTVTKATLEVLRKAQDNSCYYCNCDLSALGDYEVHLDHYIPISAGGIHSIGNVVWSCRTCNLEKRATIPDTPLTFPIKQTKEEL